MSALPSGTLNLRQIMDAYNQQHNAANTANEGRYQDILKNYRLGGKADRADITRSGMEERASGTQDLMSRGLFNTTVLDAMRQRSMEGQQRNIMRVNEGVRQNVAGVMERRTDQGPDTGMFAQLLQAAARGQGQQAGQAGQGVGQSYQFLGVNPNRFSGGGGGGSGGSGGGFGGSNSAVWFGGVGGQGGDSGPSGYAQSGNSSSGNSYNPPSLTPWLQDLAGAGVGSNNVSSPVFAGQGAPPQAADSARATRQSRYIPSGNPVPPGAVMDPAHPGGSIFGNYYLV